MKMVIEIDEEDWKDINDIHFIREDLKFKIGKAIMKGTPLPEHHGRLIDKTELSDHIKNRLIQTAMNNMETILPYSKVCTDIVDNRIDTWIDEVKTIIEGSDSK